MGVSGGGEPCGGARWWRSGVASSGSEKPGEACACASMLGGVGNILLSSSARGQPRAQRDSSPDLFESGGVDTCSWRPTNANYFILPFLSAQGQISLFRSESFTFRRNIRIARFG